jgi:peptidyl-prolyl cis-trans isomerase SurA
VAIWAFQDRNTFVKEFTAMAFKLKAGEISPVFETEYGFPRFTGD